MQPLACFGMDEAGYQPNSHKRAAEETGKRMQWDRVGIRQYKNFRLVRFSALSASHLPQRPADFRKSQPRGRRPGRIGVVSGNGGPGIFAALGVPVHSGREFEAADNVDAPPRAIVNQALARRAFPGQDSIGHTIVVATDNLKP
jgi:hypothetical protein